MVDTSSLLAIREEIGKRHEKTVLSGLGRLVEDGRLVFPPEVVGELERGSLAEADPPLIWARKVRAEAERKANLETVKAVLKAVPDVLDADSTAEQADPYLLALALDIKGLGLYDVIVVTEDRKDKPTKPSLATAAGILKLPTVPLRAFLRSNGLLPTESPDRH